jgi:hypothetical protein
MRPRWWTSEHFTTPRDALLRITHAEGGEYPGDTAKIRQIVTRYIYLPTAFSFTVPFAMIKPVSGIQTAG